MTLRETSRIDIATTALDGRPGGIDLYIVDPGTADTPDERLQMLSQKLQTYVAYIFGPDLVQAHPEAVPQSAIIWVLCQTPPTKDMQRIQRIGPVGGKASDRVPVIFHDMDSVIDLLRTRITVREAATRALDEQGH